MNVSVYHKFLRISAVVVTLVLLFDGGFISPLTKQLSDNALLYLASNTTGLSAQVKENELNQISAELRQWEDSLALREAALDGREIQSRDFSPAETTDYSTYILSTILFILTVLIALNYALDFARLGRTNHEHKTA